MMVSNLSFLLLAKVAENVIEKLKEKETRTLLKMLLLVIFLGILVGVVSAITYNLMFIKGNVGVEINT